MKAHEEARCEDMGREKVRTFDVFNNRHETTYVVWRCPACHAETKVLARPTSGTHQVCVGTKFIQRRNSTRHATRKV